MTVKDLDESVHFYCELLGGEVSWRSDYEPGIRLYVFDPNGIEIELVSDGVPGSQA